MRMARGWAGVVVSVAGFDDADGGGGVGGVVGAASGGEVRETHRSGGCVGVGGHL